eukprot:763179-Hanusia_phi.AAC.4
MYLQTLRPLAAAPVLTCTCSRSNPLAPTLIAILCPSPVVPSLFVVGYLPKFDKSITQVRAVLEQQGVRGEVARVSSCGDDDVAGVEPAGAISVALVLHPDHSSAAGVLEEAGRPGLLEDHQPLLALPLVSLQLLLQRKDHRAPCQPLGWPVRPRPRVSSKLPDEVEEEVTGEARPDPSKGVDAPLGEDGDERVGPSSS